MTAPPADVTQVTAAAAVVDFAATHAPVFVVGMERGGTSVLVRTLATAAGFNPQVAPFETFVFDNPPALLGPQVVPTAQGYLGGATAYAGFRAWFDRLSGWPADWRPPRRAVSAFFYYAWATGRTERILEKTPRHALKLGMMVRCFPNCRIVGVHRHPFGVIGSYRRRLARERALGASADSTEWLDRSPARICQHIDTVARALDEGLTKFPKHLTLVSYDALLRDPAFVIAAVADFCGIDGVEVRLAEAGARDTDARDPLLNAGGIVTSNTGGADLPMEEKLKLLTAFPDLFRLTSGVARAR